MDLAENPPDGYSCIYQNIEGVKSRNEFYKRIFDLIIQCVHRSKVDDAKRFLEKCLKKYSISEISKTGVKFSSKELNYEDEFKRIIPELAESKIHTIIFLDEFAEVINKLTKKGEKEDAIDILHTLREIRSDSNFRNFTLVFAGSIGLEFVIKSFDRPKLINDLHAIPTPALSQEEGVSFLDQLVKNATIRMSPSVIAYILKKVHHLMPYYLQLIIEEIDLIARENNKPNITKSQVDESFTRVLRKRRNFEDWLSRLKEYQSENFPFINEVLINAAHNDGIDIQKIYDIACDSKFDRANDYMDYIDELINDGYLIEIERHKYSFISPFLKEFWKNKYPVYNDK